MYNSLQVDENNRVTYERRRNRFFSVDSFSDDDDIGSSKNEISHHYNYIDRSDLFEPGSAAHHVTKIPLVMKILTFACKNPRDPLRLTRVHSSWDETVRDYAAVSHVWNRLLTFDPVIYGPPFEEKDFDTVLNRDELEDSSKFIRDKTPRLRRIYSTKIHLIALMKGGEKLHWYLEKVFDAGVDDVLLYKFPIYAEGHALNMAVTHDNMAALDFICDVVVKRPENEKHAKRIFNYPCVSSKYPEDVQKKVRNPIEACLGSPKNNKQPNKRAFSKLLRFCPEYVDINAHFNSKAAISRFPLWVICEHNSLGLAQLLLPLAGQCRLDVNQTNQGVNSLFIACQQGHDEIVDLLLNTVEDSLKLDLNMKDTNLGMTALYIACGKLRPKCVELLLKDKRLDLTATTHLNATPLHIVSQETKDSLENIQDGLKIIKMLIDAGMDVNALHSNGYSPVAAAVAKGNAEAMKVLIENGGSLNWSGTRHKNLAELARATGHQHIITQFLKDQRTLSDRLKGFMKSLF